MTHEDLSDICDNVVSAFIAKFRRIPSEAEKLMLAQAVCDFVNTPSPTLH